MNIVFFGSSEFALLSLEGLLAAGYNIPSVVTQPDRKKGRGLHMGSTAVKETAKKSGVKVYQPARINNAESSDYLRSLKPDLFVVVAYGQILSPEILGLPRIFAVNAHGSLLPKYRGAAPVNWAIINGEEITGVTIIKMTGRMDAGPVICQKSLKIEEGDTALTLGYNLSRIAAELLLEIVPAIESNAYVFSQQDERKATLAPKLKRENGMVNWGKTAREIFNLVRGCSGWPGTYTYFRGKLLKIYKARVGSQPVKPARSLPGQITGVSREGMVVSAGEGNIIIEELQMEGKRPMMAGEFISGHKISLGEILGIKK